MYLNDDKNRYWYVKEAKLEKILKVDLGWLNKYWIIDWI